MAGKQGTDSQGSGLTATDIGAAEGSTHADAAGMNAVTTGRKTIWVPPIS